MKWSDLTLKERKQIYDAVRVENPNASYFDIKSQFDSIPGYEDGKDNSVAAVYSLPEVTVYPQNKFGDIARTQGYETAKNWQTVRNATTAGINEFVNDPRTQMVLSAIPKPGVIEVFSDAVTTAEDLEEGNYGDAAVGALMNVIPWGIGKGLRKIKPRVSNILNIPIQHLPGTANHELRHLADSLASDANNRYLTYLLDEGNIMGPGELISKGINVGSDMQSYLLDPSESKSHMLHLKRALVNEGKFNALKKRTGKSTEELTHSKNPLTRKRAISAQKAAKWNKSKKKK